jgi:hypothetical protein
MTYVLVFLMATDVVVLIVVELVLTSGSCPLGVPLPLLLYLRGEVTRKVTDSVTT